MGLGCFKDKWFYLTEQIRGRAVFVRNIMACLNSQLKSGGPVSAVYHAIGIRVVRWIANNSSWLALGVVVVAFAVRLFYSHACYLNPDEASHFDSARPSSWLETYKAAFMQAHPPLFIMVLHGTLFWGRSELVLRLPSLVGGTAALWLTFAWIRRILGEIPALAGLGFMALSPAAISASTEVRQYGLLLCFVCGSLYATERAFAERSMFWTVVQGLFLVGAVLTHYVAVVVVVSLGLYVLLRCLSNGVPRRMLLTTGGFQLLLAALLAWLYFGHVRRQIPFGPGASMSYLRDYYYDPVRESPLGFTWRSLTGTFSYAVGVHTHRLAILILIIFLAGLAALLAGRAKAPLLLPLLVVSPFAFGFAASVLQVFPFGGTRHQTYLLPFLAVGISAAFACLPRELAMVLLMLAAAFVAPFWLTRAAPDNNPQEMNRSDMTAAIEYVERMVPRGSQLFVDYETRQVLRYYLARDDKSLDILRPTEESEQRLGGYDVVVPRKYVWEFLPDEALEQASDSARALGMPAGNPLWLVSTAWLHPSLASRLPSGGDCDVKDFGRISIIRVREQRLRN